ncbi:VWA domain-containing protein [Candidatus Poribacteria bacterium]|nr:VWA domain-containing protein [Candidatus Poribacteria bacterium]MYH83183.1 VWA domain-containing protein [Candidatus Poribacteria bacterium]MYK96926.1 VWA domain-containing protein [Candidatus Poribacteria bacterium]
MPFGLTFLTASFAIAGAIGASIPLILHLLNRERARRLIFSTVRFIQMSHQTNVRRHKLKRLLLLLMRILMLALLGLAFARPFFADAPEIIQKTGGKRNAVIVLDTSYSMQYEDVFENAKKEVGKILDGLDASDAACLILSSDNARVVAPLGSEFAHIRTALNNAEPSNERTDYLDAMQTADEILQPIPIGEKQVYLIADMQKRGWENFIETDKLSPDIQIHFVDVGAEKPQNYAITQISVPPVVLKEQKASQLVARVRNFGDEPVENLQVRLFIDGNVIDSVELDIEPDDFADAVFKVEFQDEATHTGWVELPEDALSIDNKRYFTLQSLQSIKVHAVREEPRTRGRYQTVETFFMKKALASGRAAVQIDFTESVSVPNTSTLASVDVLILADVAELSSGEAERVKTYVAAGGGLIVTVGNNISADTYKQQLGGETGLMPCDFVQTVGDALDREQFRVLATVKYEHPIFVPFKEPNHGDFGKARFYRIFQAVPTKDASVIAAYDDGSPALFEKPYGTLGRVLCFTSTIDREWNDLPIRAVYLPFLHESIKYLALKDVDAAPNYRVGDSVELKVSDDENGEAARSREIAVFNPNNVETRLQRNEGTTEVRSRGSVFYDDTAVPGIYSVHTSGAVPSYFVVNVDTTESDLAARDVEELTSMLKGTVDESVEEKPTAELVAQYHEDVEKNQNVWIYLMLAVFALAVTEMFVANRV